MIRYGGGKGFEFREGSTQTRKDGAKRDLEWTSIQTEVYVERLDCEKGERSVL